MSYANHARVHSHCGQMRWKPIELVAIVLGFIFFWPVGLGLLAWKIFKSKTAYAGDFGQFAQEKWGEFEQRSGLGGMARPFAGGWPGSSGNAAFDDWRKVELERLEEERRRIFEAEKAFSEYQEGLRRARDREEFERFMASRGQQGPTSSGGQGQ